MKLSEITVEDVVGYIHAEESEYTERQIKAIMAAATRTISEYTGIPMKSEDDSKSLDDYEEFYIAFMVLCQDMYDNRSLIVSNGEVNRTVRLILGLNDHNLVG